MDALVGLGRRIILYDGRGMGSSDRDCSDFSLGGRLRDLEAVIGRSGVDRLVLWCVGSGGPTGIAYAASRPDRVARLVLGASYAKGADRLKIPLLRAARAFDAMTEEEWEYYTLQLANAMGGFRDSDVAKRYAPVLRSGMSARTYISLYRENDTIDVTEFLPLVKAATLVLHLTRFPLSNLDLLRAQASGIPNARLVRVATAQEMATAIDAFLRETEADAPASRPSGPGAAFPDHLTPREIEVLRLIAAGRTNAEISRELVLSARTVARHITNIYSKIGARSKVDAASYAMRHGLTVER